MKFLFTFSSWSALMPLLTFIFRRGKRNREQVVLKWVICVAVVTEIILGVLWHQRLNNLPLFHIYPLIELALLTIIYRHALGSLYPAWLLTVLSLGVIGFSLINSLVIQGIFTFSSNAITLESGLLIFYSISYFYVLLREPVMDHIERRPMFWINCAVLIYFSGSFIIYMYSNYMLPRSSQHILWGLHAVFNVIMYVLYTIALWRREKI